MFTSLGYFSAQAMENRVNDKIQNFLLAPLGDHN